MKRFCKNQKGQTATEYMLIVAVIVLGLVAAASQLIPKFRGSVEQMAGNVGGWLETNQEMAGASE
ncbi:MAG: hypothetical protein COV43_07330 [Deltaproteobacteria bacterium CG11_big_fil_rev_8_21_14_0_20_42_23]|nr:MAG: hypothetical protein COV43_07330 [Deltaproteobacteria bacterium CG11_big_fil_rev_8_21_14_0_20_42_23]